MLVSAKEEKLEVKRRSLIDSKLICMALDVGYSSTTILFHVANSHTTLRDTDTFSLSEDVVCSRPITGTFD